MKLVILGPPGAGKGTQSVRISEHFGIVHISTGELLREEMEKKTVIGCAIYDTMNAGKYVSDEIVTEVLLKRLSQDDVKSKNGFILDGYPRNMNQAKILDDFCDLTKVISVEVPDESIVKRMASRLVCSVCKSVYNIAYCPPKTSNVCDDCGGALYKRPDDEESTVLSRLRIYHEVTEPIKKYYGDIDKLLCVSGDCDIYTITDNILKGLDGIDYGNHNKKS